MSIYFPLYFSLPLFIFHFLLIFLYFILFHHLTSSSSPFSSFLCLVMEFLLDIVLSPLYSLASSVPLTEIFIPVPPVYVYCSSLVLLLSYLPYMYTCIPSDSHLVSLASSFASSVYSTTGFITVLRYHFLLSAGSSFSSCSYFSSSSYLAFSSPFFLVPIPAPFARYFIPSLPR